jgi:tRNA-dihydrouridine synthase 3
MSAYLDQKPRDILFPENIDGISNTEPLACLIYERESSSQDATGCTPSIDLNARCPIFEETGDCRHGFKCRFLGAHVRKSDDGKLELVKDEDKVARTKIETTELNYLSLDALKLIRGKKVGGRKTFMCARWLILLWHSIQGQ